MIDALTGHGDVAFDVASRSRQHGRVAIAWNVGEGETDARRADQKEGDRECWQALERVSDRGQQAGRSSARHFLQPRLFIKSIAPCAAPVAAIVGFRHDLF